MPIIPEIVVAAIIGGLFGVGGTLMTLAANGKLTQASTANQISLAWAQLIQPYQQQLASQYLKIVEQDKTILILEHRVELLETQLELLGAVPKTKAKKEGAQ